MATHSPRSLSLKGPQNTCNCGASGCVVYPAIPCNKNTCRDKSTCAKPTATKIFFNEGNYKNEIDIYKQNKEILKRLDRDEKYFLSSYEACDDVSDDKIEKYKCVYDRAKNNISEAISILPDSKLSMSQNWLRQLAAELEKEKTITEHHEIFKAINFSYLGIDMEKIIKGLHLTKGKIESFFVAVENIFQGLKVLNHFGVYHCDIKPQNIVLDASDDKFKIIDFGLAMFETNKSIIEIHSNTRPTLSEFGFTPGFISPEFYYHKMRQPAGYGFNNPEIKINEKDKTVEFNLQLYEYEEAAKKFRLKGREQTLSVDYYEGLNMCPHITYYKNDIWAMGCVLKFITNKIVNLLQIKNETYTIVKSSIKSPKNEFNYVALINELNTIIEQLLCLNLEKRPNADQALNLYHGFLEKVFGISYAGGKRKRKSRKLRRLKKKNKSRRFYH